MKEIREKEIRNEKAASYTKAVSLLGLGLDIETTEEALYFSLWRDQKLGSPEV